MKEKLSPSAKQTISQQSRLSLRNSEATFTHSYKDGRILDCNKRCCQILGYSPKEFKRIKIYQLHPPEVLPEIISAAQKYLEHGIILFEAPMIRKNGKLFFASITGVCRESREGLLAQNLIRDLSENEKPPPELDRERAQVPADS